MWFVIAGLLIIIATLVLASYIDKRDKKRAQIYRATINAKNGKIELFKKHF